MCHLLCQEEDDTKTEKLVTINKNKIFSGGKKGVCIHFGRVG